MYDVDQLRPKVTDVETYARMAHECGLQVKSCQISRKTHQYNPMVWKAVNPFLQRITDGKEKEDFVEALDQETTISLPEYPIGWSDLFIGHICN